MMEESKKATPAFCFVPEMLVDYLNKSNIKVLEPASFFMHGVCLLVDISGFTKLSGQFCDQGKAGIDDLQLATNGFMGQLVDIIYTFGGDIIKFAGDAIICVFSAEYKQVSRNRPLRKSSMGNFSCAKEWQRSMGVIETPSTKGPMSINTPSSISAEVVLRVMHCAKLLTEVQTDKLTVHVAVSCGEMCFGILGGFENRWECLISGPCIHQLSDCLDDAPSKHAVISRRCARIVREAQGNIHPNEDLVAEQETNGGLYSYSLHPLPSGNNRIVEIHHAGAETFSSSFHDSLLMECEYPERFALVNQFVPLPIADQLEQGTGLHFLAEIREVTTMFMKWDSYEPKTNHRDLLQLQTCFYQAQRILHNTGAYLRQFLVDDKGCVLIGCWGMPRLSYLDNAHRALSAAAQIKHKLNKLGMNCSFGITTGDVYCGTVGSPVRQEYAAIGSVVNMSARLMGKANGGILIDDATHARLHADVLSSLNRLDPIIVKGRDEPLQVYSYTASGAMHVREKVVEDHEISAVCKNTLLSVVDTMVSKDSKLPDTNSGDTAANKKGRRGSIAAGLADMLVLRGSAKVPPPAHIVMPVVLLQGKEGSGRTTVIRWLKSQAIDRKLRVISTKASKKESAVEYVIWRKLFQQLMPKDLFLSNETQRSYVRALLKEVFPDQPKLGEWVGFPALKNYLGITCSYTEGALNTESSVKISAWGSLSRKDRRRKPSFEKDKSPTLKDTMHRIFAHLLNLQTSLVIIENVEHADEASLELLVDLTTKLSSRSVICLTALLVDDKNGGRNKNIFQSGMRSVQVDAFHSTAWSKVYQSVILKNKSTISVTLENYTPEEIDKMLSVALGVDDVPFEISQLVQDFSGGAYFWVHEILQFIKEHGGEQFMSAIGENEMESCSTPTSNGRPIIAKPSPPKHASMRQLHNAKSFAHAPSMRNLHGGRNTNVSTRNLNVSTRNLNVSTRNLNMSTRKLNLSTRKMSTNTIIMHQSGAHRSQVKLDKLVLCRFENLHSHVQHVLRTASIIGMTFNSVVLYSIIPRHLKDQMSDCINTLLDQKWLYQDTDNESLYQFAHPHAHQIIYELTPSSERSNTHKAIAAHMEFTCGEDRAQFGAICFHYQHCDTDKALQYAVKAVAVMLESKNIFEYGDCLDLLFTCFNCCKNSFDVDVLMKLVNDGKLAIERLDLNQNKPAKRSFFSSLFSCSNDTSAVSPEEMLQHKLSFSTSSDDDSTDLTDPNYELRAKLVFLEQLDKLNDRLCESYVDLVDNDDATSAKEWQRNVLGMNVPEATALTRLVRAFSGVFEVDENLERRHTVV